MDGAQAHSHEQLYKILLLRFHQATTIKTVNKGGFDMADTVYETRRGASAVAWTALVLALLSLVIAWLAYNRSGKDLEDTVGDNLQNGAQQINNAADDAGDAAQDATDATERELDTGPDGVDDGAE